jgi:hypothetical protein
MFVLTWAGFQMKQSIVLALILTWIGSSIGSAAPKETVRFSPHFVRVRPKWYQILMDYKILKSDEWEDFQERMDAAKLPEDHIFRAGVHFTVVHQSADGECLLVYRGPSLGFVGKIDWIMDLTPARFGLRDDKYLRLTESSDVDFFIKQSADGYGIGIRVPFEWWQTVKALCPAPVFEERDHPCGAVDLAIAVIPFAEFRVYWEAIDYDSKFVDKIWNAVNAAREKFNWKYEDQNDQIPELQIEWPTVIVNKYFEVDHALI